MAASTLRNHRLADYIRRFGFFDPVYCQSYFRLGRDCYKIPFKSVKCEECARSGRKYIDVSWRSVDSAFNQTSKQLRLEKEKGERLLEQVVVSQIKRRRFRRTLERIRSRVEQKMVCISEEIDKEDAERKVRSDFSAGEREDIESGRQFELSLQELAAMSPGRIN